MAARDVTWAGRDRPHLNRDLSHQSRGSGGYGVRGNVLPARPARRNRSTRRRQDTPDLPRRTVLPRTIGKTYTAPDGKTCGSTALAKIHKIA